MPELLTPLEAVMWRAGAAADLRPDFVSVSLLAHPPGRARLRRLLLQAASALPTLRRTVRSVVWPPGRYAWIDDADFDIDHHLRHVTAPGSGQQEDVLELVALLSADPLPGDGPSWEFVIVDGLDRGRGALVQRLHHSLADGVDAVRLWRRLLSEAEPPGRGGGAGGRSVPPAAIDETAATSAPGAVARAPFAGRDDGRAAMALLDRIVGGACQGLATGLSMGQTAAGAGIGVGRMPLDPRSLATAAVAACQLAADLAGQTVVGGHLSPLMRARSHRVELGALSVPLTALRTAARAGGAGPNDALVAGVAAALGDYHRNLGHDCARLRFAVPVRRGGRTASARNGFAPMRFVVPVAPPQANALLPAVAEAVHRARTSPALALTDVLAATLNVLPTPLLVEILRHQSQTVDAAVSLVVGMRRVPSLAGMPIEATYPFGPRLGAALNVTALPMGDQLHLGVNIDPAAVTQPAVLMACLRRAFDAFVGTRTPAELASVPGRRRVAAGSAG